ncbi:MAG: ATP-binding protein [Clostridiales Family XIII bacterium]|jgi:SpoVK/Ycf46/Vps4 family AAA+-type ATPase|nr:ATP-binding protein [Clostridiales Family XIII bacterium]
MLNGNADGRVERIRNAFGNAINSGSLLVLTGNTGDLYVADGGMTQIEYLISKLSAEKGMPTLKYSLAKSAVAADSPNGPKARVPSGIDAGTPVTIALDRLFAHMSGSGAPGTLLLDFAEAILPGDDAPCGNLDSMRIVEQIVSKSLDVGWKRMKHCLVITARTESIDRKLLHMPGVEHVEIALPAEAERRAAVDLMTNSRLHSLVLAQDLDTDRLASLSGGMTLDAISRMRHLSSPEKPLTLEAILEAKKTIIRRQAGDSLFIHDEKRDMDQDVAGLPQVRRYIEDRERIGTRTLRLLLAGPPGTGKTLVGVAIALRMGTVPVSFRLIKNRYVGDSERNLCRALDVINNSAPCTVIIDEADQAGMGRRAESSAEESSAVESSLRGILMEWLGDVGADNGISLIALTNNPAGIDRAFLSRLDALPVLEPASPREQAAIMDIQARRMGVTLDFEGCVRAFSDTGNRVFSGRHIIRIFDNARICARYNGRDDVQYDDIREAVGDALYGFGPKEEYQALRAIEHTGFAKYLPWVAARRYFGDDAAAPPAYIRPYINNDGTIDMDGLGKRIKELEP